MTLRADEQEKAALRLGWGGAAVLIAFWTFYGGVMFGSLYLSALPRTGEATPRALLVFAFTGAYAWALLTLPLFKVTERFNLASDGGAWRAGRVAMLLGFGLAFAVALSIGLAFVSSQLLQGSLGGRLAGPDAPWVMLRYRVSHDILAGQCVLAAGIARDYFLRHRMRLAEAALLRSQLADARLQLLQSQLNPHFLFNTLNAVAALVQSDPRGVRRMIALLSELMRESLYGTSEPEVPLDREVATLSRYLEIMEIRFRGRLRARLNMAPDVGEALVPPLILQPLVENALKHGVGSTSAAVDVEITGARVDGELVLTVRDAKTNGAGREPVAVPDEATDGEGEARSGFGLRHTRERLHQLYGEAARLDLHPSHMGGMLAEVRLPYRTVPARGP